MLLSILSQSRSQYEIWETRLKYQYLVRNRHFKRWQANKNAKVELDEFSGIEFWVF